MVGGCLILRLRSVPQEVGGGALCQDTFLALPIIASRCHRCKVGLWGRASMYRVPLHACRVLGGGVVPGSLVLIGGDPGVGKSTLTLQVG